MWSLHQQGNCVAAGSIERLWALFLEEACFLVLKDIPLEKKIILFTCLEMKVQYADLIPCLPWQIH